MSYLSIVLTQWPKYTVTLGQQVIISLTLLFLVKLGHLDLIISYFLNIVCFVLCILCSSVANQGTLLSCIFTVPLSFHSLLRWILKCDSWVLGSKNLRKGKMYSYYLHLL